MKPLIVNFSGGKTSGYMAYLLKKKYEGVRDLYFLFFNTSKEREETYSFVRDCDERFGLNLIWLEADYESENGFRQCDYNTAKRNGEVFEEVIKRHGIPNVSFTSCTREMKVRVANKWIRHMGLKDYEQAIGIRADEPKRIKDKPRIIYPLFRDFPTTKRAVNAFWDSMPFTLNLQSHEGNCDLCYKKSKRKLLTILVENPELADWWNEMEVKYGDFVPESQSGGRKVPITFFRGHESTQDLLEDSKFPFRRATDSYTNIQQLMFSEPELDFTNGCEESCEAF